MIHLIYISLIIVTSFVTFLVTSKKINFSKSKQEQVTHGVIKKKLTGGSSVSFSAIMDVFILEQTSSKCKIQVFNIKPSSTKFNSEKNIKEIIDIYNNSWVEISEIDFVDGYSSKKRQETLNKIINKNNI